MNAHDAKAEPTFQSKEHNNKDSRNWSKFAPWGERDWAKDKELLRKKKWMNFSVWGKRNLDAGADDFAHFIPDKRKWYPFVPWGKRDAEGLKTGSGFSNTRALDVDKSAWSRLPAWDKRKIEEGPVKRKWTQLPTRDKRGEGFDGNSYTDSEEIDAKTEDAGYPVYKKNWSKFVSWGKRASSVNDNLDSFKADKRKWSAFPTWGKRNENDFDRWNLENARWFSGSTLGKDDFVTQSMNNKHWTKLAPWVKPSLNLNSWNNGRWWPVAILDEQDGQGSFNNQADYDILEDRVLDDQGLLAYIQFLQTYIEALMTYIPEQNPTKR